MSTQLTWHTVDKKISDLVPNINNPRTMSPKQVEDLKRSLQKFDLVELPVADLDNTVISGHQRLMVLKLLGRENETIPVRIPNRKLTQKEYDQYLLTSNRVHGDWDWQKLADNFDIETLLISGFDDMDMSHIFDDLEVEDDDFDEAEAVEKAKDTDIKNGDRFQLGEHYLSCGDGTDKEVVKALVGEARIDMVYVDIPYNINLSYDKGLGGNAHYGGNVDTRRKRK